MRKDLFKGICIGIVLTLAISTASYAEPTKKVLDAVYNNFKIVIDGTEITPKDASGNIVEPFIVGGTTYLPVRAVGQAFGKTVTWDGSTNTVYVGKKSDSSKVTILDLKPYDGRGNYKISNQVGDDGYIEIRQDLIPAYSNINSYDSSEVRYFLKGKYSKMTAFFARDDSDSLYASEGICHLLIYGDYDKVLFNLLEYMQVHGFYKRGDNPIPVEIDLTGVDELRFNVQYATLYNIEFTPAQ